MEVFILKYIFVNWGSLISLVMGSSGQFLDASPWLNFWSPEQARLMCTFLQLLVGPPECKAETRGRNSHYALPADDSLFSRIYNVFPCGVPKTASAPFLMYLCLLLKFYHMFEVACWSWKGETSLHQRHNVVLAAASPLQVGSVLGFLRSPPFSFHTRIQKLSFHQFSYILY